MAGRRPLTDGLKPPTPPIEREREKEFVYGENPSKESTSSPSPKAVSLNRVPVSTRIRGDFAAALKRCSLERQLNGIQPNTLQDILEQAIEPWLKSNGYLG